MRELPTVPRSLYGNNLDPAERPGAVKQRLFAFDLPSIESDASRARARARADPSSRHGDHSFRAYYAIHTPHIVELPARELAQVRLDPAQTHALHVGVGMKSMDDRWLGRLYFQEDGSCVLGLWRSWTRHQIFELRFRAVGKDSQSSSSSSVPPPLPPQPPPRSLTTRVLNLFASATGGGSSSRSSSTSSPTGSSPVKHSSAAQTTTTVEPPLLSYRETAAAFPPTFPILVLTGLTREANTALYKSPLLGPDAAQADLDDALDVVRLLLKMRVGIDEGTWGSSRW
ncbi:hypothetical protein OC835_001685 [Tilletia horrida]|nr:hypothetical protein OC835_001685 [Tilletia horrida]